MNRRTRTPDDRKRAHASEARKELLDGLPLTERRIDINGAETMVLDGGSGPTLLLLHGGIASGGVYWAPIAGRLAETNRLLIPDVPGLGESEPVARLDAGSFAAWLTTLIHETCPQPPTVIAHSLIASLTARFAAQHPGKFERLMLIGAPGIGPFRPPPGLLIASIRLDMRPSRKNLDRLQRWPFLDPEGLKQRDPSWFEAFDTYLLERGSRTPIKRTMRQLLRAGTRQIDDETLRRIPVPVDLVWGGQDRMTPLRLAERAASIHGWPLSVIDDSGHVPQVERPDVFLDAIERLPEKDPS